MPQANPSLWQTIANRRMIICIFTGFTSGLPLYLIINLIPAWLRTGGVDLKTIGFFALIQIPYTWKFLWAPLMDRYALPFLGRRRGWMAVLHIALLGVIAWLGTVSPRDHLFMVVVLSVLLATLSASLDIVIDAFRRNLLPDIEQDMGNTLHINAYKLSTLVPGSLALILSDHISWAWVFLVTALFMLPGLVMTLLVKEPRADLKAPRTLRAAIIEPFAEFFSRQGISMALLILTFILLYKLGDSMCTALATPFYLDMGFSRSEIGIVAKNSGLWLSIIGGLLGGVMMTKIGINKALWLFGLFQAVAILGFAYLAWLGTSELNKNIEWVLNFGFFSIAIPERLALLGGVIGFEAFGVGLGTAASVTFIARTTHPAFVATQFALLSALSAVPRTFVNATTGILVEHLGWFQFFVLCYALAIPGMLLLFKVAPWKGSQVGFHDNTETK